MMNYKLNQEIPLKYHLEVHSSLPNYPSNDDFIFDVINYLVKVFESKSKTLDSSSIKFSTKTLKYVYGDKFNQEFIEKLKPIISSLVEEGILTKKDDTMVISKQVFEKFYLPITQ